ncbi:MAG: hemolysin family protein [Acidobacteria bacterium]|nr:hemolysin family protein [Acidobacteriota bacterium]
MSDMSLEVVLIIVLILVNGVFSLAEFAMASSRKARLQQRLDDGDARAKKALALFAHPLDFLSTVQIGITLIGVLAGAMGGATLAGVLATHLERIPVLAAYASSLALGIVVLVITFLTLVVGELVPKKLALQNPEAIISAMAQPMGVLTRVFSPLVRVLSSSTSVVLRLVGVTPRPDVPITEEELQVLLDQGRQAGVFEASEQDMVEGVFRLTERRVFQVMKPRTEIIWLDINEPDEVSRGKIAASAYARFPVCADSLDNVLGVVRARDWLLANGAPLKSSMQPAHFVPETAMASRALDMFRARKPELMLVIDEFGGVQGLLTITDLLSEIVEGIDTSEPQAVQRQDGSWLVDGLLSIDDFKDRFEIASQMPDEDNYESVGGFVMMSLGRIPKTTDRFDWEGLRFEVMDMDGKRVDKVLVTRLPAASPGS